MAWNGVSEDQLFTHSRISEGSAGLFSTGDDERALRHAWHTDAHEALQERVLRRILNPLDTPEARAPEARAARRTMTTAAAGVPGTAEWLKRCGDEARTWHGRVAQEVR